MREGAGTWLPAEAEVRLGPVMLGEQRLPAGRYARLSGGSEALDAVWLVFILDGEAEWSGRSGSRHVGAGDVLVLDSGRGWGLRVSSELTQLVMAAPRAFLAPILPLRLWSGPVSASAEWGAVRVFVQAMRTMEDGCFTPQSVELWTLALREMLGAAAAASVRPTETMQALRGASLLDRLTAHIDADLTADLSVEAICSTLACSRSSLYRAAGPSGGIAELIAHRRLAAIYRLLGEPSETRPISVLAASHGFADPGHFNRRFKRIFGTTAGRVREQAQEA